MVKIVYIDNNTNEVVAEDNGHCCAVVFNMEKVFVNEIAINGYFETNYGIFYTDFTHYEELDADDIISIDIDKSLELYADDMGEFFEDMENEKWLYETLKTAIKELQRQMEEVA